MTDGGKQFLIGAETSDKILGNMASGDFHLAAHALLIHLADQSQGFFKASEPFFQRAIDNGILGTGERNGGNIYGDNAVSFSLSFIVAMVVHARMNTSDTGGVCEILDRQIDRLKAPDYFQTLWDENLTFSFTGAVPNCLGQRWNWLLEQMQDARKNLESLVPPKPRLSLVRSVKTAPQAGISSGQT